MNKLKIGILIILTFIFCPLNAQLDDIEFTKEEQTVIQDFYGEVFKRYGRIILSPEEWREMYKIKPKGVNLFAGKLGVQTEDFFEMMALTSIKNKKEREQGMAAFEQKYPHLKDHASKQKQKELERKEKAKNWTYANSYQSEKQKLENKTNLTDYEKTYLKQLEYYEQNPELMKKMDEGMKSIKMQTDFDNMDMTNPNLFDMFKDGSLKDSMVNDMSGFGNDTPNLNSDFSYYSNIFSSNNYVFSKLAKKGISDKESSIELYSEIVERKGKQLIRERTYKKDINKSNNEEWKRNLTNFQNNVERLRQWTLNKKGKTIKEWGEKSQVISDELLESQNVLFEACPMKETNLPTWEEVRRSLNRGEAAIEVIRIEEKENGQSNIYYCFSVIRFDSEAPVTIVMENGNEIESQLLKKYKKEQLRYQISENVSKAYWGKLRPHLEEISKVYFSPDGVYHIVNPNIFSSSTTTGNHLIDELDIQYVFSTQFIAKKQTLHSNSGTLKEISLFGGPNFDLNLMISDKEFNRREYPSLNFASIEVESIQASLKSAGHNAIVYTGDNAREKTFKNTASQIIHIASHSFFNKVNVISDPNKPKNPSFLEQGLGMQAAGNLMYDRKDIDPNYRAGIAFAGANTVEHQPWNDVFQEDGILFASEVEHLNMSNTELVFLNACNSGRGDISIGEGVKGLQRAFFSAGADCLIVSQNPIEDEIGKTFATLFYKKWLVEELPKNEAFRKAQIELKNQLSKTTPLYKWGSFVMIHF